MRTAVKEKIKHNISHPNAYYTPKKKKSAQEASEKRIAIKSHRSVG
jgi:hypothetical protein